MSSLSTREDADEGVATGAAASVDDDMARVRYVVVGIRTLMRDRTMGYKLIQYCSNDS